MNVTSPTATPERNVVAVSPEEKRKRKKLTDRERLKVCQFLMQHRLKNGKIKRGMKPAAATLFNCSIKTITNVWDRYHKTCDSNVLGGDFKRQYCNSGKKRKWTPDDILAIKDIPRSKRQNLRSLAKAIKIPKSTLHRLIKNGLIKRHSSSVKPMLTQQHKIDRVNFVLEHIQQDNTFDPMYDTCHLDEKWFYMEKVKRSYYLHPSEDLPERKLQSKRHIRKIMFLAIVARPSHDHDMKSWWDGLIGIFLLQKKCLQKESVRTDLLEQ